MSRAETTAILHTTGLEMKKRPDITGKRKSGPKLAQNKVGDHEHTSDDTCSCAASPIDDNLLAHLPFYKRLHHKFGFKVFVFLLLFSLDAADLISDWLLYHDISTIRAGLVYGPPNHALTISLLIFSIIGTLTFIFEVTNLWFEVFKNNAWIDSDLMSAITLWIEDVPQIIINISITLCRDEAISYFQLVKAAVIIIGCMIRVILTLVRYCGKKARHDLECASKNPESLRHVIYRFVIMLGMLITLGGAISVFLFTQYQRNPDGSINFRVPDTLIKGELDDKKYFHNVSIYFSHPLFDYTSGELISESEVNWIRMVSLYDVTKQSFDRTIKFEYDPTSRSEIAIWTVNTQGQESAAECFQIDRTKKILQNVSTQNCEDFVPKGNKSEIILKFHFIKPDQQTTIFGDIKYNVKVIENGHCHPLTTDIYDNIKARIRTVDTEANAAMHYFRTKDGVSEAYHVIHESGSNRGLFYHSKDLIDISRVWKTGFAYCKSSGSLAPHYDTDIDVGCS